MGLNRTTTASDPTKYGINRGTNPVQNIVLTMPVEASQTILSGDFVAMDDDGHVSIVTAKGGDFDGIAQSNADNSEGSAEDMYVAVLLWGITEVDAIVQYTGDYDDDIEVGQLVYLAAAVASYCAAGQAIVSVSGGDSGSVAGLSMDAVTKPTSGTSALHKVRLFFNGFNNAGQGYTAWNT